MQEAPVYSSALGISVGDLVRTSYGTGPYAVERVSTPEYYGESLPGILIVRTWPVVSLGFSGGAGISTVRQEGARWFTDNNDEIFVAKVNTRRKPAQLTLTMFGNAVNGRSEPYPFRQGVDYTHNAWRCKHCGDFNADPNDKRLRRRWHCPLCGKQYAVIYKIILLTPRVVGKSQMNEYTTALDALSFREQSEVEAVDAANIHDAFFIWLKQQKG